MKISEDDFFDHGYGIRIECNDNDRKFLAQQILENQEKAEFFDNWKDEPSMKEMYRKYNDYRVELLEGEINHLKNNIRGMKKYNIFMTDKMQDHIIKISNLKKKLEKIETFQKWLERDVIALKINKVDETAIKAIEFQNKKLKAILDAIHSQEKVKN